MVVISDCEKMFWGVTIDAGKRYSQVVDQGFHVSMAALDCNAKKTSENIQVMLQHESAEYLLCTLNKGLLQQPLDLNFATGEEVSFSLNGTGVVHLTGYLIPDDETPEFGEESFSDDDDEEIPSLIDSSGEGRAITGSKRKASEALRDSKKLKLLSDSLGDDDDDDDEDDEDYSEEEEGFSDDFEDDSDFEDDDEDDMEEDEVEEISPKKKTGKSPMTEIQTPKQKNKENAKTLEQQGKTPKSETKSPKQGEKTPKGSNPGTPKQQGNTTPATETPSTTENGESAKKKKKKKKKKKNKDGDNSLNESGASTPATTPKTDATPSTPKKRVVSGGTVVEDLKVGHGPEAKPGKMVSVYYVGTLAKNNKRFDSCSEGKPFRFRLNQGEVIKGWDNGVNGMKVGGKRRITVPANQGYGNMKQGPIPPNSTLVFEVELKAVS